MSKAMLARCPLHDYADLAGTFTINSGTGDLTANGGNPDLKPLTSTNYDATVEYYFSPTASITPAPSLPGMGVSDDHDRTPARG